MALEQAPPAQSNERIEVERQAPFYRFYLLRADGHFAGRREDYFAAAISVARHVVGGYQGVESWCGARKVNTLSREEFAQIQPAVAPRNNRAALLISRNKRLPRQATATAYNTQALCASAAPRSGAAWARLKWQHRAPHSGRSGGQQPLISSG
jgi:hypothetical protein